MSDASNRRFRAGRLVLAGLSVGCCGWVASCTGAGGVFGGGGLPAEQSRVAIQSQCAQNVIECTTVFPEAFITANAEANPAQQISLTENGFLVEGDGNGAGEQVQLIGSGSRRGDNATMISYSWSSGATDTDPCTLAPGPQFSTQADPLVELSEGFHYIRLTVTNDNEVDLFSEACGIDQLDVPASDFLEVEIEVRD